MLKLKFQCKLPRAESNIVLISKLQNLVDCVLDSDNFNTGYRHLCVQLNYCLILVSKLVPL